MRHARARRFPSRACVPRVAAWVAALALVCVGGVAPARAGDFRPILVDGDMSDWDGVAPAYVDPAGDQGGAPLDLGRVFIANDDQFVYLRFDIGALYNLEVLPVTLRIYVDTDASAATGWAVAGIGSDLEIDCSGQGIGVREQTAASFDATYLGHAAVSLNAAPTYAATGFEMRIRRGVALPQSGLSTFTDPAFRIAFDVGADRAPDGDGGIAYTIADGTAPPPVDQPLERGDAWAVRIVSWNTHGDLFGRDSLSFRRVLAALGPDVIGFQEASEPAVLVAARLDRDLPLPGGRHWNAFSASPGEVTASRWPQTQDPGAPSRELATLVNLPDDAYPRDLYVINGHWKCCGSVGTSEDRQRQETADATVDWIRRLRAGRLMYQTPIVIFGDFNLVGGPQPLVTVRDGDIVNEDRYGADYAPDWDGTPLARAAPVHADAHAAYTWRNDYDVFVPGILDHFLFTDATAGVERCFVLDTRDMTTAKLERYGLQFYDSELASDHLPVVVDFAPGEPVAPSSGAAIAVDFAPNPVRARARVRFMLARAGNARVDVLDVTGRHVRTLARGPYAAGIHRVWWDVREEGGAAAKSGVYFVRVTLEGEPAIMRRLVVVR